MYILDVVQDLLAVVVVLVEPVHDLQRGHQEHGGERLPQRCLKHTNIVSSYFKTLNDQK